MKPEKFPQANAVLTSPADWADGECGDLPVYTDGRICISLWKMTWQDKLRALLFGKVWIYVWSGQTQPPIGLIVDKTIFMSSERSSNNHAQEESRTAGAETKSPALTKS